MLLLFVSLLAACNNQEKQDSNRINQLFLNTKCKDSDCLYERVPFSLDKGETWHETSDKLEDFDVWDIKINKEVPGMIFFYATSYKQFEKEVKKHYKPKLYTYSYPSITDWDHLLTVYDEAYFEDNIVLFYYKYEPNISENYIYNVTIKDNALTLNVNRFEGMLTALSSWLEFVTLKKEDVGDVNEFNVIVRTITELQSSIVVSAKKDYIRDIYMNGLGKDDFPGLDNLKAVDVWTSGLMVDIHFNQTVSNEYLDQIITYLESSDTIRSVGYISNTRIRVVLTNVFYDKHKGNKLKLYDLIDEDTIEISDWTIEIKGGSNIVLITLKMEKLGRAHYEAILKQLKELDFPFIYTNDINEH